MLLFWVVNSAEIRCAPKKTRGPTPTMRKPTLMYQRRLCIDDRPASAEGAATSRVTARQDQLCAPLARTPSLDRYAGPMPELPKARMTAKDRARLAAERLKALYPAVSELKHANPFQMLVATILSAQTTDRSVNSVTPALFAKYPDAAALAHANPAEVEAIIKPTGFFHVKAKTIIGASAALLERFHGEVPPRIEDLVTLPGVGRKTANVVLGVAFGIPGFAVDTHVKRLTRRLGLTKSTDPVKIGAEVTKLIPREEWTGFSLRLILHGRRICVARAPRCPECVLNDFCPSSTVLAKGRRRRLTATAAGVRLRHGRRAAAKRVRR